ncbi:WXG100 family type VII secretion target [Agromyces sp. NPDC058136]|uniref:WXG100 family type VII secretion target n=1 Tax=Agromyces sp. NPDC058136 TaxID=3346354 RepID=UPI0036DCA975
MERLHVEPSGMTALAEVLEKAATGISSDLDALADASDQLRLEWEGEAQEAFDDAQTRFRFDAEQRRLALVALAGAARKIASDYGTTDREASLGLGGQ